MLNSEIFLAIVAASTPLLWAGLGLLINEKAGVLNLGAEGMLLLGALLAFIVTQQSQNHWLGLLAGMAAGIAGAAVFGWLSLIMRAQQLACGLALALFATGLSAFWGQRWVGLSSPLAPLSLQMGLPLGALLLAIATHLFLRYQRAGLILRSLGISPYAAFALGMPVLRWRFYAVIFGGACAGIAGAYLSLVYTPMWVEGMSAGRGWIALALTTFASWRPLRLVLGAGLFGAVTILQFHLQAWGLPLPSEWLAMLPYLASILVLVLISGQTQRLFADEPATLGQTFDPQH